MTRDEEETTKVAAELWDGVVAYEGVAETEGCVVT